MSLKPEIGELIGSEGGARRHPLVFSCFYLDRGNERLRRGDEIIKLPPKAFALLCYLAERPQQLIEKRELLRALALDAEEGLQPANVSETVLVGRERELKLLKASFDGSSSGRRRIVFLTGEAGIGKTSLVDVFLVRVIDELVNQRSCAGQTGSGSLPGTAMR